MLHWSSQSFSNAHHIHSSIQFHFSGVTFWFQHAKIFQNAFTDNDLQFLDGTAIPNPSSESYVHTGMTFQIGKTSRRVPPGGPDTDCALGACPHRPCQKLVASTESVSSNRSWKKLSWKQNNSFIWSFAFQFSPLNPATVQEKAGITDTIKPINTDPNNWDNQMPDKYNLYSYLIHWWINGRKCLKWSI